MSDPDALVSVLASGRDRIYLAKSILDDAGIPCMVHSDQVQDFWGFGQIGTGFNFVTGPMQLLVNAEDAPVADALLGDQLKHGGPKVSLSLRLMAITVLAVTLGYTVFSEALEVIQMLRRGMHE